MNRKRVYPDGRTLGFESLETRRCLAGNVTASLVGGDLVVEGDAEANTISIVEAATDGEFIVLGGNDADGAATNVNRWAEWIGGGQWRDRQPDRAPQGRQRCGRCGEH